MPPTPERGPSADDPPLVDSGPRPPEPAEELLADELSTERAEASAARTRALAVLRRLGNYDRAVYGSVARLSTPLLDQPLRRVSGFANFSKPWFITAGFLALFGGPHGRRAALTGLAAIGAASLVVNQPMKLIGERHRPDRDALGVPQQRWVTMPSSTSFPSGHSASAAAFAVAVGDLLPALKLPLRGAASVVAFSRVYTGVHYPSDVLVGAAVGALLGRVASTVARRTPAAPTPGAHTYFRLEQDEPYIQSRLEQRSTSEQQLRVNMPTVPVRVPDEFGESSVRPDDQLESQPTSMT